MLTFVKSTPGNLNFASSSLSPGDFLTKISATDQDSKMNSDITYNISNKDAFNIDPTTGIISVKSFLTKSDNRLTITVEDNGAPSSATEKNITYFWKKRVPASLRQMPFPLRSLPRDGSLQLRTRGQKGQVTLLSLQIQLRIQVTLFTVCARA